MRACVRACVCVCVCVLEKESSADLAEITENLAFSPSSFTKRRKDKLFPAVPADLGACVGRRSCPRGRTD